MARCFTKFLFLLILVSMVSCEEDYIIHRSAFKPSIVINSIFTVGKPWIVDITYSRDILNPKSAILPVENAEVIVVEKSNKRQILLKHQGNGKYQSDIYTPIADKTYELEVYVQGYEVVKASSMSPKNADVVILSEEVDIVDSTGAKIDFEILDQGENYYIWDLVFSNTNNPLDTSFTGSPKNLVSSLNKYNDLTKYINGLSNPSSNDAVSTGGQTINYNKDALNIDGIDPDGQIITTPIENKKYIRLLTASKDLYSYYKTVQKFIESDNHNSSFSQAPEIYSNITNGLGIFAGYTEKYTEIK